MTFIRSIKEEEHIEYALICQYCSAVHIPVYLTIPEGKEFLEGQANCAKCGKLNWLRIHRLKLVDTTVLTQPLPPAI